MTMNRLIVLVTLLGTAHVLVVRAGAGWAVTLLLWLVSVGALAFWGALIGSALWGLEAAVAGRRPGFVVFQRYAGAGAGLAFGLLVLRALTG
jgi:hypothetical protein